MSARHVVGVGLHTGRPATVTLAAHAGRSRFGVGPEGPSARICDLRPTPAERSTTVHAGGRPVSTVEHLFAACAALGLHDGLSIRVVGDELPLLDGGAGAWTDLLVDLAIVPIAPRLHVRDEGVVRVGQSTYAFARGPLRATQVHVEVDYGDARLSRHASWSGDARDFRERIAPARTFGFAHEMGDLALRGLARHAAPESVVLVTPNAILTSGRPFDADEPARHKLLDLIGDLFLYGGPPLGVVRATRPGHSATHEAMRVALERGLVARA